MTGFCAIGDLRASCRKFCRCLTVLHAAQEDVRRAFSAWAAHVGKAYASEQEFEARLQIWAANVARQAAQAANSAEVAVNGLADLTREEFRAAYLGQISRSSHAELRCPPCVLMHACTAQTGCSGSRLLAGPNWGIWKLWGCSPALRSCTCQLTRAWCPAQRRQAQAVPLPKRAAAGSGGLARAEHRGAHQGPSEQPACRPCSLCRPDTTCMAPCKHRVSRNPSMRHGTL